MDAFDVLNVWYGRTVIRSSYKLSYEVAQRIFDPPSSDFLKNHCNLSASELCLEKIGGVEELTKLVPELKSFDRVRNTRSSFSICMFDTIFRFCPSITILIRNQRYREAPSPRLSGLRGTDL